ncbi:ATP-binding cassette sub- C member 8 [Phlyctochytrium planicorne]|nr:ATP-binding cassette sub- C member 8 [Phlyctochytrium planicorne]
MFFYSQADKVLRIGEERPVVADDVPKLPTQFQDQVIVNELKDVRTILLSVHKSPKTPRKPGQEYLNVALATYGSSFVGVVALKLIADSGTILVPVIIREFVKWTSTITCQQTNTCMQELKPGGIFVLVLLGLLLVQTISMNFQLERALKAGFKLKTFLSFYIFRKSLELTPGSKRPEEINRLIENDSEKIFLSMGSAHTLYSAPLIIITSVIVMATWIGSSAIVGFLFIAGFVYGQSFMMRFLIDFLQSTSLISNQRVQRIRSVLAGLKSIKANGMEKSSVDQIAAIRKKENARTQLYLIGRSSLAGLTQIIPFFGFLVTLTWHYAVQKENVDIATILSCLAMFQGMRVPMILFPQVLSQAIDASKALQRIRSFLNAKVEPKISNDKKDSSLINVSSESLKSLANLCRNAKASPEPLAIKKGSLVAVVGPVGSGKSSLLKTIASSLDSVAMSSSPTWLFDGTVAENIALCDTDSWLYNQEKIFEAIESAGLKKDVEDFSEKELTMVGEASAFISGGQRNRIGLARAFFQDRDVLLMDTPFLGVDRSTARDIFENTIIKKLSDKTRIFTTTDPSLLSSCDTVLVLKNGAIAEQGSLESLQKNPSSYVHTLKLDTYENVSELDYSHAVVAGKEGNGTVALKTNAKPATSPIYAYYTLAGGALAVIFVSIFVVATQYLRIVADSWLLQYVKTAGHAEWPRNGAILFGMGFAQVFSILIQGWAVGFICLRASTHIHTKAFDGLVHAPMSFFFRNTIGSISSRFGKDISDLDSVLPETIRILFFTVSLVLANLITVGYASPNLYTLLLPTFIYFFNLQAFFRKTSKPLKRIEITHRTNLTSFVTECINGSDAIQRANAFKFFETKFSQKLNTFNSPVFLFFHMQRWLSMRLDVISAGLSSLTMLISVFHALSKDPNFHTVSLGWSGMALLYCLSTSASLTWAIRQISESERLMVPAEKLVHFAADIPSETQGAEDQLDAEAKGYSIEFKSATLNFVDVKASSEEVRGFKDVQLKIPAGSRFGIVGRTGSGKTTLASSVVRLFELDDGSVLLDGKNVRDVKLEELRSRVAYVSQDPVMFPGTIRYNLDSRSLVEDSRIMNLLQTLGLKEKVESSALGLNTLIENITFTSGEQQLICLARALLRNPKVLILDEATSNLDVPTQTRVKDILSSPYCEGMSILIISHQIPFVSAACGFVAVMEDGKLVEIGTVKDLSKRSNGKFSALAR